MDSRKQDRMKLIAALAALGFVLGSLPALAQEKSEGKKPTAGGPPMGPMKPPAEMAKYKDMIGTWKCNSKMHLPPEMGGEQSGTSTMTIKRDMNGFWMVGQWKMDKTKAMPAMTGTIYWGYDPAEQKFIEVGLDSTGSWARGTSDGPQNGTWVWNEEGVMMGKKSKTRTTVNQKGNATQVKTEMEAEPGKWVPMGEDDCKKAGSPA